MEPMPVWSIAARMLVGFWSLALMVLVGFAVSRFIRRDSRSTALALVSVGMLTGAMLLGGLLFTVRSVRAVRVEEQVATRTTLAEQAAIDWESSRPVPDVRPTLPPVAPPSPLQPTIPTSAIAAANSIPATDDRSTVLTPQSDAPEWVRTRIQSNKGVGVLVAVSKQYATEAEADADAYATMREYLRVEQRRLGRQPFTLREEPAIDPVVKSVIKDRYVEAVQRDFGSMFATMYRVWLRAEITPSVYQQLQVAQLTSVQEGRMLVAGSGLFALLSIPLGIVSFGQLNRWSGGRFRRLWQYAISAGILTVWLVGFVLLQRVVAHL